jgi:hypothetical protein
MMHCRVFACINELLETGVAEYGHIWANVFEFGLRKANRHTEKLRTLVLRAVWRAGGFASCWEVLRGGIERSLRNFAK